MCLALRGVGSAEQEVRSCNFVSREKGTSISRMHGVGDRADTRMFVLAVLQQVGWMPKITNDNTHSPTLTIAKKAARWPHGLRPVA